MDGKVDFNALLKLPKCEKCQQTIVGKMLRALGKTWHDTCFVCTQCNKSLAAGYQMDESRKPDEPELPQHKPHCPECYSRLFMPKCKGCGKNISDPSYVQACKGAWHEACFVCGKCRQPLGGEKHWPVDEKPYCQKDYWDVKMQTQAKKAAQQPMAQPKVQPKSFVQAPMRGKSMIGKSVTGKSPPGKATRPLPKTLRQAPKSKVAPKPVPKTWKK